MKKALVVFVVSFILSSCSSLIPDQKVTNPFGLDGKTVTLEQAPAAELNAQAVSVVYSGNFSASFNDLDQDLPAGIRPSGISENLGIAANVSVSSASATTEADFPATLSIVASKLEFTVTDGSGNPSVTQSFNSVAGLNLVVTKGSCTPGAGGITCAYTTNAVDTILLLVQLVGGDFSTFFDILSGGTEPNNLTGKFSVTLSGDTLFPTDSKMTVTLKTSQGTLTF